MPKIYLPQVSCPRLIPKPPTPCTAKPPKKCPKKKKYRSSPKVDTNLYYYQHTDFEYVAVANCDANRIKFFGSEKTTITKETAALIVVFMDLLMILFFWLALICIKPFIDLTEDAVI